MGLVKPMGAAVLSETMATFLMGEPARRPNSISAEAPPSDIELAMGEVWKMYLKPRSVICPENDNVSMGSCSRSVTSVMASVNDDNHEPVAPTKLGYCEIMRCAALRAVSGLSPASTLCSFILAPPSALIPPAALMSSMAISAPLRIKSPERAHGPVNGAIRATSTSLACA